MSEAEDKSEGERVEDSATAIYQRGDCECEDVFLLCYLKHNENICIFIVSVTYCWIIRFLFSKVLVTKSPKWTDFPTGQEYNFAITFVFYGKSV